MTMTDQEALEKAIQKAIDGGWHESDLFEPHVANYGLYGLKVGWIPRGRPNLSFEMYPYQATIFNHDFAKALWGDQMNYDDDGARLGEDWKIHLQQMVIAENPIKYLGENT